eukprot:gnl/MRDRNA2_/MRDRNA2_64225_c0_seq2.p1 gnl/MRDRNA2_/MRDRNA2_64225_c0~~gnl/MRDRNA2_/MRDRNA2_64225_c0_seq2.p1  ORF type:complete len:209 (-),score=46.25 gnl/MRDRNA2_/MRDRNA2_64225_c0_seq2:102-728(-)
MNLLQLALVMSQTVGTTLGDGIRPAWQRKPVVSGRLMTCADAAKISEDLQGMMEYDTGSMWSCLEEEQKLVVYNAEGEIVSEGWDSTDLGKAPYVNEPPISTPQIKAAEFGNVGVMCEGGALYWVWFGDESYDAALWEGLKGSPPPSQDQLILKCRIAEGTYDGRKPVEPADSQDALHSQDALAHEANSAVGATTSMLALLLSVFMLA